MLASISLDLDNKWSYMKTNGGEAWKTYPSYLPTVVPSILSLLKKLNLPITFFIVGKDATLEENFAALRSIGEAGHEIGNHSFHHEPWLHLYSREQIDQELVATEEALMQVTGQRTLGFRGPGFSHSPTLLQVLKDRGYEYDCSTFPTFLGPIARAYYFFHAKLEPEEREKRKQLFGKASAGFLRLRPYRWRGELSPLLEMPVTTFPWFKVPVHFSYVMFLAEKSPAVARLYFKSAMLWCKVNRIEPSLLLHPLDFLGRDAEADLSFFPAMRSTTQAKCELAADLLRWMSVQFQCVTMREHARAAAKRLPI